jgi:endo-1,4-beta-xylanase
MPREIVLEPTHPRFASLTGLVVAASRFCGILALVGTGCIEAAPAPAVSTGRIPPAPAAPTGPQAVRPVLVETDAGQVGTDVSVVTDATNASITYVTAAANLVDPPAALTDPRVVSVPVTFPAAGEYQVYLRFRIGPGGGMDDSLFVNTTLDGDPTWQVANGLNGFNVAGQQGYQAAAIVTTEPSTARNGTPGTWKWALLENVRVTAAAGALSRSFSFATREDGLDLDKFAFAAVGDGYTTGFTVDQLDARETGVVVYPPVLPPPFEPPATQLPMATGQAKYLGSVCCANQRQGLEQYFNQITPENAGKWGSVEGTRDVFDWTGLDEAVAIARANNFVFRFHVLVWGSQQPAWIATLPPAEQLEEIREWYVAVNERYGADIDFIDVVNEFDNQPPTADNAGNYVEALGGAGASGWDWVLTSFRMAREIFPPTAKLMLNEYSVLNTDTRTDTYLRLVGLLQAENLIDGIGIQGHAFSTRGPIEQQLSNLARLGATGLPVYITEMDIDGPDMAQLVDFQRLFRPFWESDFIQGITLWGYRDGHWRAAQGATLVYPNGAEKPALRWLKGYLRGTAPVVAGPAAVTLAGGAEAGAEVGTFSVSAPQGATYPAGAEIAWGIADGTAAQSVAFEAGTGRLQLKGPLTAGAYNVRVYVDADTTVSDLYDVAITVE